MNISQKRADKVNQGEWLQWDADRPDSFMEVLHVNDPPTGQWVYITLRHPVADPSPTRFRRNVILTVSDSEPPRIRTSQVYSPVANLEAQIAAHKAKEREQLASAIAKAIGKAESRSVIGAKNNESAKDAEPDEPALLPDDWAEYRYTAGGPLLTPKVIRKWLGVSGPVLSKDVIAVEHRRENPDGRGHVYRYADVARIANRKPAGKSQLFDQESEDE